MVTKNEFKCAIAQLVTKTEFQAAIRRLEETMYTKADHAKFMEWIDEAMTELRDARDERKLSERQILRIDDLVFDHEKRIRVLEKK